VGTPENQVIPPTLVFGVDGSMAVMQEEIFGPILPVLTYCTLQQAIDFVNGRPRPLSLYYFDENRQRIDEMLSRTLSGGVTVNDCVYHLAQHNLPFGGVGSSGMGHYHGFDGFAAFSKKRGVMVQRRWAATSIFHAPFTPRTRSIIDAVLKIALR
jgi:coniferyl-aldehyde dehydrogenase